MVLGGNMRVLSYNDKSGKKFLFTFILLFLILSSIWGQIFISVKTSTSLGISKEIESIQLMAVDYNSSGDMVLQKVGSTFKLKLGSWLGGSNKTYPAAFALVNPADRSFSIRSISLRGDPEHIDIYLHKNMTRPCDPSKVEIPSSSCEKEGDKQLYYTGGSSIEYPSNGWRLSAGSGYNSSGNLIYKNDTSSNASLRNDMWIYDENGPIEAENGTANFVWVEINISPPLMVSSGHNVGPLIIDIETAVAPSPPGPEINFMAAYKRQGGYVMYRDSTSAVRISLNNLTAGTNVTIPDAFAIVNTAGSDLILSEINISGDPSGYLRVYAHTDNMKPCDPNIVNIPASSCEGPSSRLLYYDGDSNIDWGDDGWVIGSGLGYNTSGNLIYSDNGKMSNSINATRKAGYPDNRYYYWAYEDDPVKGSNLAVNGTANFVWIEIDIVIPEDSPETNIDSELTFSFKNKN